MQGYMQRADENAIRNAVEKLGDKASPRDILNVLTKTNTYRPEAKQEALKNYLGVNEYEQLERKAQSEREVQMAKNFIEANKAIKESELKERKNEIEDLKAQEQKRHNIASEELETSKAKAVVDKEDSKESKDRDRVAHILDQVEGFTPEQSEGLKQSLSLSAAEQLLKDQVKSKRDKDLAFSNTLSSEGAKKYSQLTEEIPRLESTLSEIEYAFKQSKKLGYASYWTGLAGLSGKFKELENLSFVLMEPIIKIFNPTGAIGQQKLKMVQDKYTIVPGDMEQIRGAKLMTLHRLAQQSLVVAKRKAELMKKYKGDIPAEELTSLDKYADRLIDAANDQDLSEVSNLSEEKQQSLGDPVALTGKTVKVTTSSGKIERYRSNGITWSKV